ncbi:MAG: MBOAT family protein, partial [Bacteroidales bacterium]|nr:MBOAT family protein [Bacteroidales bacterium]
MRAQNLTSSECVSRTTWRNTALIVFSLLFYAWGEPIYVFLMLGSVAVNYVAGLLIDRSHRHRRLALAAGLCSNVAILGTFKYADFIASSLSAIGVPVPAPHIALPIGISFYTFQSISYLIDVYRRQAPVQKKFGGLLLYISMFPQLIAGPIVRYDLVAREINDRHVTAADLREGVFRFLIGLGKKVILANQFSEIAGQFLDGPMKELSTTGAWLGILAFTFQIFFDFSGYSDMAIGLGRCLGFHFAENFRHPYCCRSITEFWRRWHISLGSFFRDYVYIPMGGNRRHQALNILAVWFLTGLWHGASWNFVLWGLYFGIIVTLEKYTLLRVVNRVPRVLLHLYSLLLVVVGWGIFYFEDFSRMGEFFSVFTGHGAPFHDFTVESAFFSNFWLWVTA